MAFPALLGTGAFQPHDLDGVAFKEIVIDNPRVIHVPGLKRFVRLYIDRQQHEEQVTRAVWKQDLGREVTTQDVTFNVLHCEQTTGGVNIYRGEHCNDGVWQVGSIAQVFGEFDDLPAETPVGKAGK